MTKTTSNRNTNKPWYKNWNTKEIGLVAILLMIGMIGPSVAFAGVSVVYPESTQTTTVDTTPAINFDQGTDWSTAKGEGWVSSWSGSNNNGSYSLSVNGLSGGKLTVDDLVNVSEASAVSSYEMEVSTALGAGGGTLTTPNTLKIRLWNDTGSAPSADGDANVCATLDLTAAAGTASGGDCSTSTKMQLIYDLPSGASESSDVKIRPTNIS